MRIAPVLLLALAAVPAPQVRYFKYQRNVEGISAAGQTCVAVDPAVFVHAAPQLADVRLYSGSTETPYALRTGTDGSPAQQQEIAPLNLGRRGNATVFDADMPAGSYADVELSIKAQDFIAGVTVSGSRQTGAADETRLGTFTIFDLTKQKLGRSTVLHLPQSDFRVLHFRIDGPIAPENVTGISVVAARAAEPKYATVAETAQVTQKGHQSIISFDVPAHTPVDRVVFVAAGQPGNFSRDVTVTARPAKASGQSERFEPASATGNLLRVHRVEDGRRIDEERLDLSAPTVFVEGDTHWIITIDNGDDAPLRLAAVRLEMMKHTLCFDGAAGGSYTLDYGDPALSAPQYDYARLFVPQPSAVAARLEPERANPEYQPRRDERPFTERHPALLWIALGAVVLLLGAVALRSAKTAHPEP